MKNILVVVGAVIAYIMGGIGIVEASKEETSNAVYSAGKKLFNDSLKFMILPTDVGTRLENLQLQINEKVDAMRKRADKLAETATDRGGVLVSKSVLADLKLLRSNTDSIMEGLIDEFEQAKTALGTVYDEAYKQCSDVVDNIREIYSLLSALEQNERDIESKEGVYLTEEVPNSMLFSAVLPDPAISSSISSEVLRNPTTSSSSSSSSSEDEAEPTPKEQLYRYSDGISFGTAQDKRGEIDKLYQKIEEIKEEMKKGFKEMMEETNKRFEEMDKKIEELLNKK
ncbi:MAG: hypothetical protein LBP31_02200 [Holosporales bacterium]|nr:hypothetical protein [Holosporales bacterium]